MSVKLMLCRHCMFHKISFIVPGRNKNAFDT
jgi:hypothetical protein